MKNFEQISKILLIISYDRAIKTLYCL